MNISIPKPNKKQELFLKAVARYVLYGGARGGGKSWAVRIKIFLLVLFHPGITILLLRRTYPDLLKNHIEPLRNMLEPLGAVYKDKDKTLWFHHGKRGSSQVIFGYCDTDNNLRRYQGQQYDVIFIDEATQFKWEWFDALKACVRGVGKFPRHIFLTANPGDIGHAWVKRLFIDRDFLPNENPDDYVFIPATVYDNDILMANDPEYVKNLESLSEKYRDAWLYGRWDSFEGQYFTEWREHIHVIDDQSLPDEWRRYVAFDYGLDMLAAYVIAVDPHGQAIVEREHCESGLIVSEAIKQIKELCGELSIYEYLAPPDMWNRRQETGRSVADIFAESGIYLRQASNDRVNGWLDMHEWLKPYKDEQGIEVAGLRVMRRCRTLIRCIPLLQYDQKKHSDVATEPHDITHAPDAIRYFCAGRPYAAPEAKTQEESKLPFALRDDKPQYNGGVMDW